MPAGMKGVQIGPGSTPFTRMPFSANKPLRPITMLLSAPFVAE